MVPAQLRGGGHRTAVVDIGSNSIRLVVFQGVERAPAVIFNEKVMAGLGRELNETGAIGKEAIAIGQAALKRFRALCDEMAVDETVSFATAAVRDASNGGEFLALVEATGFATTVLSGEMEAQTAAMGVISAIPGAHGIVGDLGGGSLELSFVEGGKVHEASSFPLGVLRVGDLRSKRKDSLKRQIRKLLAKSGWGARHHGLPLYLVGGSWRSLARVDMFDSGYPLPVIHHYEMEPARVNRLVSRLAQLDREKLKTVPGLSSSRIPTLGDAAWLLSAIVRMLGSSKLIVSAAGVREGLLFQRLDSATRAIDPLLAATAEVGADGARFTANGALLDRWIAPAFADDPPALQRIRQAACNLCDVAWRANPNFRAERGLEIGLHGNWVGITGAERELLGQALYTSFGGGVKLFPGGGKLSDDATNNRAIRWGLAMRLGQRLSGGTQRPLETSALRVAGDNLLLTIPVAQSALYGISVARRHRHLASMMGLKAKFQPDG
ncbi:MAG: Ppx/GppA family phosphatase [Parasphingorhabdus sp.]|nr:Ppx/GppA family phosphatase [Parasphingorhabdus sp.]